jgi:hypothetical protein
MRLKGDEMLYVFGMNPGGPIYHTMITSVDSENLELTLGEDEKRFRGPTGEFDVIVTRPDEDWEMWEVTGETLTAVLAGISGAQGLPLEELGVVLSDVLKIGERVGVRWFLWWEF